MFLQSTQLKVKEVKKSKNHFIQFVKKREQYGEYKRSTSKSHREKKSNKNQSKGRTLHRWVMRGGDRQCYNVVVSFSNTISLFKH